MLPKDEELRSGPARMKNTVNIDGFGACMSVAHAPPRLNAGPVLYEYAIEVFGYGLAR